MTAHQPGIAIAQAFRGTVDNTDYSLAVAVRLLPHEDRIQVCGLGRITAPVNLQDLGKRSLSEPGSSLTLTPNSGGAPIVLQPGFIPVEHTRGQAASTISQSLLSDLESGMAGNCQLTQRLWREELRNGEFSMQLVPLMPDQRLRRCSIVGAANPVSCPVAAGSPTSQLVLNWQQQPSQLVGTRVADVIETIPTALARERVTIISVLRTFESNGNLAVCGALVLAAPQTAMSQLDDFVRSRDVEVVVGGQGPRPVRLPPSFLRKYQRITPTGLLDPDELYYPRLSGDCIATALPWRTEYHSGATLVHQGGMPDPLYPLPPVQP